MVRVPCSSQWDQYCIYGFENTIESNGGFENTIEFIGGSENTINCGIYLSLSPQSRFGLCKSGSHPYDQPMRVYVNAILSIWFAGIWLLPYTESAAILRQYCSGNIWHWPFQEISINQRMPVCAVNIAKGGENATDIKKDKVGAECHRGPIWWKGRFKGRHFGIISFFARIIWWIQLEGRYIISIMIYAGIPLKTPLATTRNRCDKFCQCPHAAESNYVCHVGGCQQYFQC